MDFKTTVSTILKWVVSCDTLEQMSLCSDAIDVFIIERFEGKVDDNDLKTSVFELHEAMAKREVEIVKANVVFVKLPVTDKQLN